MALWLWGVFCEIRKNNIHLLFYAYGFFLICSDWLKLSLLHKTLLLWTRAHHLRSLLSTQHREYKVIDTEIHLVWNITSCVLGASELRVWPAVCSDCFSSVVFFVKFTRGASSSSSELCRTGRTNRIIDDQMQWYPTQGNTKARTFCHYHHVLRLCSFYS